jgi:hypothetical protein
MDSLNRTVVQVESPDLQTVVSRWVEAVARDRDLTAEALTFLAAQTGRDRTALQASCAAKTAHDLERFWDNIPVDRKRNPPAAVCHWLMQRQVAADPLDPVRLAAQLEGALGHCEGPWRRVLVALSGLLARESLPGLLLIPPTPCADPVRWLTSAALTLTDLVSSIPDLPAALATEPTALDHYRREAPESHAHALLREGIIPLSRPSEASVAQQLSSMGVASDQLAAAIRQVTGAGASPELVQALGAAAVCLREPLTKQEDDQARSAAERFLFELLQALPETAGLFELNASPGFRFGHSDAEVDLLARSLSLALEIDGYYHFRDPEAYRRDRRKDWELQRHGYLVLRVLAADVVTRLEEILDRVRTAVDHCQRHPQLRRMTTP